MLSRVMQRYLVARFFCTSATGLTYLSLREKLMKFPYCHMPEKISNQKYQETQTNAGNDFLAGSIAKDSIAYAALKQYNNGLLKLYTKYLFGEDSQQPAQKQTGQQRQDKPISGNEIFTKYFMSKIQQVKSILENSTNEEQITYYLKILFYLKNSNQPNPHISSINLTRVEQKGTLQQKAYLLHLNSEELTYLQFLEKYSASFMQAKPQQKIRPALVIISIPNFKEKLNRALIDQSINVISNKSSELDDWQHFRIMQFIFEYDSPAVLNYLNIVQTHIFKQLSETNIQTRIPLLIKIIKLRDKLGMDNSEFEKYIKQNPLRFSNVFFKKKINKQAFLDTIASKDSKRYLPEEIRELFVNYVTKDFKDVIDAGQCDKDDLIETIKMSLKFYFNFKPTKLEGFEKILEQNLLPMFDHEPQLNFWLLTFLIRINAKNLEKPEIRKRAQSIIQFHHKNYINSKSDFEKHVALQKIIEMNFHLSRANVPFNEKRLIQYDFKHVRTFQIIIFACNLIIKMSSSPETKWKIMGQMLQRIEILMKEGKFKSIKNIFVVVDALSKSKTQANLQIKSLGYAYKAIQQAYMSLVARDSICPKKSDLIFMKNAFVKDRSKPTESTENKNTPNFYFVNFLNDCIFHPENFKKNLAEYQEKTGSKLNKGNHHKNYKKHK